MEESRVGEIDLLVEEADGWVIVDYKTDDVSGKSLEQCFPVYPERRNWYVRAVHQAAGGKLKGLFFFHSGEERPFQTDEETILT